MELTRRKFLTRSALIGCSVAASPVLTPVTFASAPFDHRLVVIILRGAMDGMDVVQPYGDRELAGLRPMLPFGEVAGSYDLGGFYAMHQEFAPLQPLWKAGELAFAHAVSTPYRDQRSHFDGQDLLEAGTEVLEVRATRDGWLNRMLQEVPGIGAETAYAVGHDTLNVLSGAAPVANWAPDVGLALSPQARRLMERVMHDDTLFREALAEAAVLSRLVVPESDEVGEDGMMASAMMVPKKTAAAAGTAAIAAFAAERSRGASRIAAFSINGWDTHAAQSRAILPALGELSNAALTLKEGFGREWEKTAVVAVTEFGRTARGNGTGGTDHGTGGAMLFAGGAIKGGQVLADWPGLGASELYQGRDLMPTRDVRAHLAWVMRGLFGFDQGLLERAVIPGLDMEKNPGLML